MNINMEATNFSSGFLVLAGILMSVGVVVPGVSNTLILMCLGVYPVYLSAIAGLNFSVLIPMGIGLIIGCALFLLVIKVLLKYFYMQTYYSIIGFTLGSVLVLYTPIGFDISGIICIILMLIGAGISARLG